MKLLVTRLKRLNPWVLAARRRKAGAHRPSAGGQRLNGKSMLRREIEALRSPDL